MTRVEMRPSMKELQTRYRDALRDINKTAPLFAKIAVYLDRWNKQNFRTEGGKVGGWEPLRAGGRWKWKTVGGKKKRVFDPRAKILQDTGRLRLSFLPFSSRTEAGIGSDLDYAEKHQYGFGALPERRMIPKEHEVIDDVMRIAEKHTERALRRVEDR